MLFHLGENIMQCTHDFFLSPVFSMHCPNSEYQGQGGTHAAGPTVLFLASLPLPVCSMIFEGLLYDNVAFCSRDDMRSWKDSWVIASFLQKQEEVKFKRAPVKQQAVMEVENQKQILQSLGLCWNYFQPLTTQEGFWLPRVMIFLITVLLSGAPSEPRAESLCGFLPPPHCFLWAVHTVLLPISLSLVK